MEFNFVLTKEMNITLITNQKSIHEKVSYRDLFKGMNYNHQPKKNFNFIDKNYTRD